MTRLWTRAEPDTLRDRALELDAAGVMFPRLDTPDEVIEAVAHLRHPPEGDRGVATYNRACGFGPRTAALDTADDAVIGVIQIETLRRIRVTCRAPRMSCRDDGRGNAGVSPHPDAGTAEGGLGPRASSTQL